MASWRHAISIIIFHLSIAVTSSPPGSVAIPHHLGPGSLVLETPDGNETVLFNQTWSPNVGSFISCGARYRTDLKVMSCQDAVNRISDDVGDMRFGYDKYGVEVDVHLPSRYISYDGLCTIDIVLKDGVLAATGTYRELSLAAIGLLHRCVAPHHNGGIAMGLGRDTEIGLIMTSFKPRVTCRRGNAPPIGNCKHLQDTMTSSALPKSFGPDVKLPKHLYESNRQCEAIVRTLGLPDVSSFYEVWEAVVAVSGMCVRFGQIGTAWYRGQKKQLYIDVTLQAR
ncbi:MAG: hypothetical protein L6R36_003597 [Xanthoria steineri]|nr:MAG: hypothetical protein L6R36_003597 [Xanthoria steineri]